MSTTNTKTFTSFLRLPQNFLSPPVLENVGSESIDPTQCLITRTNVDGIFALDLSQVSWACPVQCSPAKSVYHIVASASPSRFEAHIGLFILFMKGISNHYVL